LVEVPEARPLTGVMDRLVPALVPVTPSGARNPVAFESVRFVEKLLYPAIALPRAMEFVVIDPEAWP
jgi:hypothetical protein